MKPCQVDVWEGRTLMVSDVRGDVGTVYANATVDIRRRRHVGEGVQEQLEVTNNGSTPVTLRLISDDQGLRPAIRKVVPDGLRVSCSGLLLGIE